MASSGLYKHCVATVLVVISTCGSSFGQETGDLAQLRGRALELVNMARGEHRLEPLSQGSMLDMAAQAHARDMLRRDYYAHVSPEGDTVMDRYVTSGGEQWRLTAENIARCQGCPPPPTTKTVENLHQGWMNSPSHRENILRQGLEHFGFGIVVGSDQTLYAVQTFAGPGTPRGVQPDERSEEVGAEQQTAIALQKINKERKAKNLEPLDPHPALIRAAANLVPEKNLETSTLNLDGSLTGALPSSESRDWLKLAAFAGRCGGCGKKPTAADVRSFVQQWLDQQSYKQRLLDPNLTHLGLVVRANGGGLKVTSAVAGARR